MGIHIKTETTDYSCSNCGKWLEGTHTWFDAFKPLPIKPKIQKCKGCGKKYVSALNYEFWNMDLIVIFLKMVQNFFAYGFIACPILLVAEQQFEIPFETSIKYFIFVFLTINIIYYVYGYFKSKDWIKDRNYLKDLVDSNCINREQLEYFNKKRIISDKTYNELILNMFKNSNIPFKHVENNKKEDTKEYENQLNVIKNKILDGTYKDFIVDYEDDYVAISNGYIVNKQEDEIIEIKKIKKVVQHNVEGYLFANPHTLVIDAGEKCWNIYFKSKDIGSRDLIEEYIRMYTEGRKKVVNRTMQCKACGKDTPYNENGTCPECHKLILERIEKKKNLNKENEIQQNSENGTVFETDIDKNEVLVEENDDEVDDTVFDTLKKCRICGKKALCNGYSICKKCNDKIDKKIEKQDENKVEKENKNNVKRFCTNCGKEIDSEWKYCNFCGSKLK